MEAVNPVSDIKRLRQESSVRLQEFNGLLLATTLRLGLGRSDTLLTYAAPTGRRADALSPRPIGSAA